MFNWSLIGLNYGFLIGSILLSITTYNPVHAIINLINAFFFGSLFIVILKLIFFALIYLSIYLGAVIILFLFIVMMLDIKIINEPQILRERLSFYDIIFLLLLFLFYDNERHDIDLLTLMTKFSALTTSNSSLFSCDVSYIWYYDFILLDSHLVELGKFLFNWQIISFEICGILLFIAMIGAIGLTVDSIKTKFLLQQDASWQIYRTTSLTYL